MLWLISVIMDALLQATITLLLDCVRGIVDLFYKLSVGMMGVGGMFDAVFPVTQQFEYVFIFLGLTLCILLIFLGVGRNMVSGLGFAGEKPFKMVCRSLIAIVLTFSFQQILNFFYGAGDNSIFSVFYKEIAGISASVGGDLVDMGGTGTLSVPYVGVLGTTVASIVIVTLLLAITFNFIKLALEIFERYLLLNLLLVFAPLIPCSITLESTIKIFGSYIKMFFGQMMMLLINVCSLLLIKNGIEVAFSVWYGYDSGMAFKEYFDAAMSEMGLTNAGAVGVDTIMVLLIILAMTKVLARVDNYMRDIGLLVGITGGSLIEDMMAVGGTIKTAGSVLFGKKGAKMFGGSGAGGAAGAAAGASKLSQYGLLGRLANFANHSKAGNPIKAMSAGFVGEAAYLKAGAAALMSGKGIKGAHQAGRVAASQKVGDFLEKNTGIRTLSNKTPAANIGKQISSGANFSKSASQMSARDKHAMSAYINGSAPNARGKGESIAGWTAVGRTASTPNALDTVNGINVERMGNGAFLGHNANGDIMAITAEPPKYYSDDVMSFVDGNGEARYVQNLTAANDSFKIEHNGEEYSGFTAAKEVLNNKNITDFSAVTGTQKEGNWASQSFGEYEVAPTVGYGPANVQEASTPYEAPVTPLRISVPNDVQTKSQQFEGTPNPTSVSVPTESGGAQPEGAIEQSNPIDINVPTASGTKLSPVDKENGVNEAEKTDFSKQ